jgi:acetolactate synthase I/II/III large subunit
MSASNQRSGGQLIVDCLRVHGVDTVYCLPGESYLHALDAFHDAHDIRLVVCRQEGGAAYMADADAKITGKPGVLFVSRGPGACNAAVGIHTAFQDATPMVVFIGQVPRASIERFAFQEIDYRRMYGQSAKWIAQIDDAARIPEMVSRAFHTAMSGRPGPVILVIPEDMQEDTSDAALGAHYIAPRAAPAPDDMEKLGQLLSRAERPLVLVGGSGWTAEARDDLAQFAAANALPVLTAFRRQDLINNNHPNFAGKAALGKDPKLARRMRECDLLLVIGTQLTDVITDEFTLLDVPHPRQTLVHVLAGADELGRVYQPALPIVATMPEFCTALRALPAASNPRWRDWTASAVADEREWRKPTKAPGPLNLGEVVAHLNETLPDDAIVAQGAGNFTAWLRRFYVYRGWPTEVGPINGSMGYGLPAAIAAKVRHPEKTVICLTGDGDFLMTGQELATAVAENLAIVILLVNNGTYGTIRMHQETHYPGRVIATKLTNPDFAALARAYGAHGETVSATAEFPAAFERARAAGKPALIQLMLDPDVTTPTTTLAALRDKALAGR